MTPPHGAGDVQAWLVVTDPATGVPTVYHVYDGVTVSVESEAPELPERPWLDTQGRWLAVRSSPRHRITIECNSYQVTVGATVALQAAETPPTPPTPTVDHWEQPYDQPDPQGPEPGRCTKWCCAEED